MNFNETRFQLRSLPQAKTANLTKVRVPLKSRERYPLDFHIYELLPK